MKLFDYISPALQRPLSELGLQACGAYEALTDEWNRRPATPAEALSRILSYGVPFAVIGKNVSFEKMMQNSILGILQSGRMERHIWGVMHAGALLTRIGGRVEFPKASRKGPTPDIRARWDDNVPADCEVTTVDVKEKQEQLEGLLNSLTDAIGASGRGWHLLIHVGEFPSAREQSNLIQTVIDLRPGQEAEIPNVWHVCAVPLDGDASLAAFRPAWWDDDGPSLRSAVVSISGDPYSTARLQMRAKLSFISYLNSIERKVRSQQRDPNNPYVIVVNQGAGRAMPMRHARLVQELAGRLPLWDHVSAILLFDYRPYAMGPYCWKLSLHTNNDAKLPAPAALLNLIPRDQDVCINPYT